MAAPVSIKAMLDRIGFTPEDQDRTYDITHQGIQSIADFGQLNEESLKTLCKVLHINGGKVTVGGAQVVDNGVAISEMDETNLQGMVYLISHYGRIARLIVQSNISLRESARYVSPT